MLMSPEARGAFDLDRESDKLRDRYGRNEYGESFLLARRLVESGVRLVTVVWYYICPDGNVANVWDNHGGTGSLGGITGYQMLKEKYCLPPLDLAYSALLEDLHGPRAARRNAGRDARRVRPHAKDQRRGGSRSLGCLPVASCWPAAASAAARCTAPAITHAAYPKNNPVAPEDVIATMYHALGIPPDAVIHDRQHRPHRVSEGRPLVELFG